jgi:hypothetical protein
MSATAQFFALAAIELAGLFGIWFFLKAKIGKYLELENLLDGVREEARALVLELNETADRNVSLVEDRMTSLRELLDEVDRRIGVEKRELGARAVERDVYEKLARRRPIVPIQEERIAPEPRPRRSPEAASQAEGSPSEATQSSAQAGPQGVPIPLSLGAAAETQGHSREAPAVSLSDELLFTSKTKREEALDLYRRGISADLIAARLGATVAEIELLVEVEERRSNAGGAAEGKDSFK